MGSASIQFVFFGLTAALVSNLSRARLWRSTVLTVASLVFLGALANSFIALLPLIGFLAFGYAGLAVLERGWARALPWALVSTVLVYVWLKKYAFLPAGSFLQFPYFTLGLSYIFFRVLHLLIESGSSEARKHIGLFPYLLYTLNFTTFVSGPIQRYDDFARDQFTDDPPHLGAAVVGLQLERIVRGFFKVNFLALLLNLERAQALVHISQPLPLPMKLYAGFRLAVVYPLFLYCNFSGYIDIVIALARLMRVRLPENFDRPFASSSVLDFWNRWHMTLSNWLKTYVYNPLLMALMGRYSSLAVQPFLGVVCFFVTFFLIGVWHGRTSEFVVFGVLTGCGMSINKLWQIWLTRTLGRKGYKSLANNALYLAFGRGLNFVWFAFTFFWFGYSWQQIDRLASDLSVTQWLGVWLAIWLCATFALAGWEGLRTALLSIKTPQGPALTTRYARVVYASAMGLVALIIVVLLHQPAPDIVYKAF